MDFSKMRKKIELNEYLNINEFKMDIELIADNAMKYNGPSTVYYLAANKLLTVAKFYTTEQYLSYLRYSLPFGKQITLDSINLKRKEATGEVDETKKSNKNTDILTAISDNIVSTDILKSTDKTIRVSW